MKKRSQLTLKGIIGLVSIAIVIFTLVYAGVALGSGEAYFKERSAKELALLYIDSGAMYRAATLLCLEQGIPYQDEKNSSR